MSVGYYNNTYPVPGAEVTSKREIVLAAVDPDTGERGEVWRFRLDEQQGIQPVLTGLFPPAISIGDAGRDNQPFASTDSHDDFTGGVGVKVSSTETARGRYWWGGIDTRRKRDNVLLPRKMNRGNPRDTTTSATCGMSFKNLEYVAWGNQVYTYNSAIEAWTTAVGTPVRTLAAAPTSDPVEWGDNLYFFTGNAVSRWNSTTWSTIANDAVAGVVWGGQMWLIDAAGNVEKTPNFDFSAPVVVTTGAKFTDDTVIGMTTFLNADNAAVPYIIGQRRLYSIDPNTGAIYPTGPKLPHHRFALSAAEFGGDRNMYIAQGMSVIQWGGNLAQDIGLTQDDGVPSEANGSIVKLIATEKDIFLLITRFGAADDAAGGTGELADEFQDFQVPPRPPAYSLLMIRAGSGWHPLAVADEMGVEATTMFVSYGSERYRIWFAWGATIYTIALEFGFSNPSENILREHEPFGHLITPWQDFTYKEEEKLVLLISVRARMPIDNETSLTPCVIEPYIAWDDDETQWEELRNGDGATFGITRSGRTDILLNADRYPPYNDLPPAGRLCDNLRLRFILRRGADVYASPRLVSYSVHCLKVTPALIGWAAVLDMTDEHAGKSPDAQWFGFLNLLRANEKALLHYAYSDSEFGEIGELWPVKITGVTGVSQTGPVSGTKLRISFSEVIRTSAAQ